MINSSLLVKFQCPKCQIIYACDCTGCMSIPTTLPRVMYHTKGLHCTVCGYIGDYKSVPANHPLEFNYSSVLRT